mmetsp:Transcript_158890/g.509606  ORF Transcript_158890/g.509606 Transcript_158890/m.509606 type:complete len:205 (+) Transcript_158890:517-1131(+)
MLGCECTLFIMPPSGLCRCCDCDGCAWDTFSLVKGLRELEAPLSTDARTSCFWKFLAKSTSMRYRSACLVLKKPNDGALSLPSAILRISDSLMSKTRNVGRGCLDMSVNVQVSLGLPPDRLPLAVSGGIGSCLLISGRVGVANVKQYQVDLNSPCVSPSNALKCTKFVPNKELTSFKHAWRAWYLSSGGNHRATMQLWLRLRHS